MFHHGAEACRRLHTEASPEMLEAYFSARIAHWPYAMQCGEGFTVGVFDDLHVAPEQAYALLSPCVEMLLESEQPERVSLAGCLLLRLASTTGTTQLPDALVGHWPSLMRRLVGVAGPASRVASDAAAGLARWYRLPMG